MGNPKATPGPAGGCYYVRIKGVPNGVSVAQVILLFNYTAKKVVEKGQKYEFQFSELCLTVS